MTGAPLLIGIFVLAGLGTGIVAAPALDGIWRGSYRDQPTALRADGSYPEAIKTFELHLHASTSGNVTGEFLAQDGGRAKPLMNGKKFGSRACFDIFIESQEMRWCVEARGKALRGSWSRGPEGGPLLDGAGVGARLFEITASRVD